MLLWEINQPCLVLLCNYVEKHNRLGIRSRLRPTVAVEILIGTMVYLVVMLYFFISFCSSHVRKIRGEFKNEFEEEETRKSRLVLFEGG